MIQMRRTIQFGVTFIEVLAVVCVVALVFAIVWPVIVTGRREGVKVGSIEKMRQWTLALQLYRESVGEDGGPATLGFPNGLRQLGDYSGFPRSMYLTGGHPMDGLKEAVYMYFPATLPYQPNEFEDWLTYLSRMNGNPVWLVDYTQNFDIQSKWIGFQTMTGLGAYLDGHVRVKRRTGGVSSFDAWTD